MTEKIRILVVDDEPNVTRIIGKCLRQKGFEAVELNDSTKVEEHLLYTSFAMVITDYSMPGLDGLAVLELVKRTDPGLPVVFLTGRGTIDTAVAATKGGAVLFLTKPFDPQDLLRQVDRYIRVDKSLPDDVIDAIDSGALAEGDDIISPNKILLKDEIVSTDSIPDGLVEVKFEDIAPGQVLPFSLYLQIYNKANRRYMLRKICGANTVFTSGMKQMLDNRQLSSAYIKEQDYAAFLEYYKAIKSSQAFRQKEVRDSKKFLLYGKAVEAVSEILSDPADNKNIQSAVSLVDKLFQTFVEDPVTYRDMFKLFKRDTGIFNHSANVCLLTVSFGVYLELGAMDVQILGLGGLFHDVGMNRVDKRILDKRGTLTKAEWAEIRKHPERGLALLRNSKLIPVPALRVILEHHETADGSGYPRGLKGYQIGNHAKFCRIVDKFDSMTTEKPYREAFSASEALKRIFLEEASPSTQNIVKQFIAFLGGKSKGQMLTG